MAACRGQRWDCIVPCVMALAGGSAVKQLVQVACLNRADTWISGAEGGRWCEDGYKPVVAAGRGLWGFFP